MLSCSNQQCEGVLDGTKGAVDDFDIVDELREVMGVPDRDKGWRGSWKSTRVSK